MKRIVKLVAAPFLFRFTFTYLAPRETEVSCNCERDEIRISIPISAQHTQRYESGVDASVKFNESFFTIRVCECSSDVIGSYTLFDGIKQRSWYVSCEEQTSK